MDYTQIIITAISMLGTAIVTYGKVAMDRNKTKKERDHRMDSIEKQLEKHDCDLEKGQNTFIVLQVSLARIETTLVEIKERLARKDL